MKFVEDNSKNSAKIALMRKSYIEARDIITELDRSLSWVNFIDNALTIYSIMIQIFLTIFGERNEILNQFIWGTYMFGTITLTFKLTPNQSVLSLNNVLKSSFHKYCGFYEYFL